MSPSGPLLATATAVVLVMLSGCSTRKEGSAGRTEVTYNCAANATEIRQLQSEISAFAETSGVVISLQPFTGQEKLYAMMAAGQAPDIFYTNTVVRDRLAAEGRLLDLHTISGNDAFVGRLWPDVVQDGLGADGGLYSIGNWSFTAGIYYNRDAFDEARIPYPDTNWTWDQMKSIARRLTRDLDGDGKTDRYGLFIGSHFVELLEQMNGEALPRRALLLELPEPSPPPDPGRDTGDALGSRASPPVWEEDCALFSLRERRTVHKRANEESFCRVAGTDMDRWWCRCVPAQSRSQGCGFCRRVGEAVSAPGRERISRNLAMEPGA
jgi:hypothetical protein